eukprot:55033-Eustigmatos_ZCMA.PRE.1
MDGDRGGWRVGFGGGGMVTDSTRALRSNKHFRRCFPTSTKGLFEGGGRGGGIAREVVVVMAGIRVMWRSV